LMRVIEVGFVPAIVVREIDVTVDVGVFGVCWCWCLSCGWDKVGYVCW
jgi:hypothetical protein